MVANTHEDNPTASPVNDHVPIRKSSRSTTQLSQLKDFVTTKHIVGFVTTDTSKQPTYPLFQQADLQNQSNDYVAYLAHVLATPEPISFSQAANPKWFEAMLDCKVKYEFL